MAPADGGAMHTLQSHIEDMRSSTNCKICLKPFYEPYILACGHTYCYSCLRSWFLGRSPDGPRNNKNCPDCRAPVNVQPAPNYAVRDITHMFVQRVEFIAEDETVDEHAKDMKVEAEILNKDRNGPGLFRGIFGARPQRQLSAWMRRNPINDYEDNVSRCPICAWEIEEGLCAGCGFDIDSHDLDMSDFYDTEDEEDSDADSIHSIPGLISRAPVRSFNLPQLDSDEDDSDVDHSDIDQYDEHDDFIDNENEDDVDDIDNTTETHELHGDDLSQSSHATTIQDDSPLSHERRRPRPRMAIRRGFGRESLFDPPTDYDESEDEDEDESAGFRPASESPRLSRSRRRRPIVISDDEEELETYHNANETATTSEDESGSSEDSSEMSSNPSEEDDDENGNENEEESDDTAIPPQSGRSRHERLVNHRARRPDKTASRAARSSTNTAGRPQTSRTGFAARGDGRISGRAGATTRSTYVY